MSERRVSIDVEPLSERRWTAIEERVLDRLELAADLPPATPPSRRRHRIAGTVAAGTLAAAAVLTLVWWSRAVPVERPFATARVVTADDVSHTTAGDVEIEVAPRTSILVVERPGGAWLVSIEYGTASFRVPPRRERPAFLVEAGLVRVEVIGTRFTVARPPGSTSASVVVDEGTVRVTASGAETLVHAGERWPVERTSEPERGEGSARSPDSTRAETEPSVPATVPLATHGAAPDGAHRGRRHGPVRSTEVIAEDPPAHIAPETSTEPEGDDASTTPTDVVPESTPATPTPQARFARAEALERTAPQTALREYAALAREGGPWGANALFAQGRLELDLGRPDRARALLERYLAEHPRGLNSEDARVLLDRAR